MNAQNNAAQLAVQAEPCPKLAPLVTTPIGKSWDGGAVTNREARRLVNEVRSWARQFDAPDAKALVCAMDDMERMFVRVWTEIDESLLCLGAAAHTSQPEKAKEHISTACRMLGRWNGRQGGQQ